MPKNRKKQKRKLGEGSTGTKVWISLVVVLGILNFDFLSSQSNKWWRNYQFGSIQSKHPIPPVLRQPLRLAFLGDSTCRHIFLSLAFFLHSGKYPGNFSSDATTNTTSSSNSSDPVDNRTTASIIEGAFATRSEYQQFIWDSFGGSLSCDCFTPEGPFIPWGNMHKIWQNIYYSSNTHSHFLTHITKAGYFEAHGHWNAQQIYTNASYRQAVELQHYPPSQFAWAHNWQDTIKYHLAALIPKPKYVVINSGLWPHDLLKNDTLPLIRQALDEYDMLGIYKTTHKQLGSSNHGAVPQEHQQDVLGCQLLHYCWNLSWTATLTNSSELYSDASHFKAGVNQRFAEELLDLVETIENEELQF